MNYRCCSVLPFRKRCLRTQTAHHQVWAFCELLQVALALSQSANDATATRTRSEDEDLAAAKRESLHIVTHSSRAEALSYQYWDSNWYAILAWQRIIFANDILMQCLLLPAA